MLVEVICIFLYIYHIVSQRLMQAHEHKPQPLSGTRALLTLFTFLMSTLQNQVRYNLVVYSIAIENAFFLTI